MLKKCIVPAEQLRKTVNLGRYKFNTTAEIDILSTVIGQERAVSSINFALDIGDSGYNIFVSGRYGTGKTTIVHDLVNKKAKALPRPPDWIYVYDFENPDEPLAIQMAAGEANKCKSAMRTLMQQLTDELQKTFESKTYINKKNELIDEIQAQKQHLFTEIEKKALDRDIQIKSTSMGFATIPLIEGKQIDNKIFQTLPPEEQERINANISDFQKRIQEVMRQVQQLDRTLHEALNQLNEDIARYVVESYFQPILERYRKNESFKNYLHAAAEDIIKNIHDMIRTTEEDDKKRPADDPDYKVNKYQINVLIDNSRQKGSPVKYETNPTYHNLFGRIEKKSIRGYIYTDYTMIKAGSLLAANGGYLIIDSALLLKHPYAYEALKRTLRSKEAHIEDINEIYGFSSTTALRPKSVPVNVKVILIGSASIYRLLLNYDEEFRKIFKVRADFDLEVKETPSTIKKYIQFIARVAQEEELLHFDRDAVTAFIDYGFRLARHQKKLSVQFGELVKVIRESSFWAKKAKHKTVRESDVKKALEEQIYRHDLVEEKLHESILENTINIDVKGHEVGQVNGLAVYNLGDHVFGRPSRISINTFIGSRGVINIEREARMSGKTHDKGVLILTNYFYQKFGTTMPLAFSASITFEQSYGTIDGDSASSAELYGLLSSLSGVPLNQAIAVTGSVNQKGDIQAIGGVNEKIEGFYKVCKSRKLTGEQGVIIPKANIKNLLLDKEVYDAVKQDKFHIWAVDRVEDGIRILTGEKCGLSHKDGSFTKDSIFEKVRQRLIEFARISQSFRKSLSDSIKKEDDEKNDNDQKQTLGIAD